MVRRIVLGLGLLSCLILSTNCASSGVKATARIDTSNISWSGFTGFTVPVIITPSEVPKSAVSYIVRLESRDGYLYRAVSYLDTVRWAKGEAATPKTLKFLIGSDDASASHVYEQLYADYRSNNLTTLRKDAENLLRVKVLKDSGP